ncbi:MAG TPA: hypothetical protein PK079_14095 [Leptospiraceae bacterium]|nr:hypothetical protein [Leptospiraceae bacterium]HMX33323.1 hypothetical protein [Leptospiraceae bacterium]HMY34068.1 hypothetical protein [Leptospiraceae bacterium]HMZ64585.1 hypothetical protein [Leptospiraceae bacterium]HNA10208.1 hypothetical protein [Leptospiraceae bacterium]
MKNKKTKNNSESSLNTKNIYTENIFSEMNTKFLDRNANEFIQSILNGNLYNQIKPSKE